jgi:hypothetical protein
MRQVKMPSITFRAPSATGTQTSSLCGKRKSLPLKSKAADKISAGRTGKYACAPSPNVRLFTAPAASRLLVFAILAAIFYMSGCDRNALSGSKLTLDNYNLITTGMSKGQSQEILGAPTSMETKNMVLFEKTTRRYEDGKKFVMLTFKNDQLDSKDSNLGVK